MPVYEHSGPDTPRHYKLCAALQLCNPVEEHNSISHLVQGSPQAGSWKRNYPMVFYQSYVAFKKYLELMIDMYKLELSYIQI